MFLFEARELYPESMLQAQLTLGFEELILRLSYIDKLSLYDFATMFDYKKHYRTNINPNVIFKDIYHSYHNDYSGYKEYTRYGVFEYNECMYNGCVTKHDHEDGCTEWFLHYD